MSIRKGNDIIASKPLIDAVPTQDSTNAVSSGGVYDVIQKITKGGFYHPDMFDWKWADHELNDVQWLRADTFSWQSGAVYEAAFWDLFYDMQISTYWYSSGGPAYTKSRTPAVGDAVYLNSDLTTQIGTVDSYDDVNDKITVSGDTYSYMSNTYVTPTTETVAGYTVTVYTGHSGKKIVSAGDESNVANIYTATGVAWYYIIDIPNKRFKLPRENADRETLLSSASVSLAATGTLQIRNASDGVENVLKSPSGDQNGRRMLVVNADSTSQGNVVRYAGGVAGTADLAGASGDFKGKKYLYFYVGEFTQTALENTAGITAETLNDKVDVGHQVIDFQAPTALNNYTWYRKYADGWVEQGGISNVISVAGNSGTNVDVTLPITMSDTNYNVLTTRKDGGSGFAQTEENTNIVSTSVIRIALWNNVSGTASGGKFWWEVKGMAA